MDEQETTAQVGCKADSRVLHFFEQHPEHRDVVMKAFYAYHRRCSLGRTQRMASVWPEEKPMDETKSDATDKRMADSVVGNSIRDMVTRELVRIGADGLCNADCGCLVGDLMPCGCPDYLYCIAGRRVPATDEHMANTADNWMIVPIANPEISGQRAAKG
mgnify:CR=1 FL=1